MPRTSPWVWKMKRQKARDSRYETGTLVIPRKLRTGVTVHGTAMGDRVRCKRGGLQGSPGFQMVTTNTSPSLYYLGQLAQRDGGGYRISGVYVRVLSQGFSAARRWSAVTNE